MNYKDEEIVKKFYELKTFKEQYQHDACTYLNVIILEKIYDKLIELENKLIKPIEEIEEKKVPKK